MRRAFVLATIVAGAFGATPTSTPSPSPDPCAQLLAVANRPSFGTGVCAVPAHRTEAEGGYTALSSVDGTTATYPQLLVRFGTGSGRMDWEIAPPSLVRTSSTSGWSDAALGAKYVLYDDATRALGLSANVTLPTGSPALTAGRAQYFASLNWSATLGSTFGLNGAVADGDATGFAPSVEVTAALPGNATQIGLEYAYQGKRSWVDAIYQHGLGNRLLFDVEYGASPAASGGPAQHYVGAGLSFMP